MINYAKYRKVMELTYEDTITIRRHGKSVVNGETVLGWSDVYVGQPCRISQKTLGTNDQTESVNNVAYETKLFISPDITIMQGDKCVTVRDGFATAYTAGEPFRYHSHQEVSLQREDKA